MIKRLIVGGVAVIAVGGSIWGVSGQDHTKRDTAGTVVTAGQLGVFVTHLGDCFLSLPGGSGNAPAVKVSTVEAVPCTSPHHWQVVYKGVVTDPAFDSQKLMTESDALCTSKISSLAKNLSQTTLSEYTDATESIMTPTVESWAKGDRAVDCLSGSETVLYSDSLIP